MIRIDALWLCAEPVDMRAGADRLLAGVVAALGQARAHHGYLFANARATRIKLLVHEGFGIWCAARRLHALIPEHMRARHTLGEPPRVKRRPGRPRKEPIASVQG